MIAVQMKLKQSILEAWIRCEEHGQKSYCMLLMTAWYLSLGAQQLSRAVSR